MKLTNRRQTSFIYTISCITKHGLWLLINDTEYFVSFDDYPKFKKAPLEKIFKVKLISPKQLYWKELDCNIELDALKTPKKFPLQATC